MTAYVIAMALLIMCQFIREDYTYIVIDSRHKYNSRTVIYLFACIYIFLLNAFHGRFVSDFDSIAYRFYSIRQYSWSDIFSFKYGSEIGYLTLNKTIASVTQEYGIFLFVSALLTFVPVALFFYKTDRNNAWFCLLIYFVIGGFLSTMNVVRQSMAAGIYLLSWRSLKEKNVIKYLLIVIASSLFHTTSIIFAPLYFLLTSKPNRKQVFVYIALIVVVVLYNNSIINYFDSWLYEGKYTGFYTRTNYGIALTGTNLLSAFVPLVIFVFIFLNRKAFLTDRIEDHILFNGAMLWGVFTVTTMIVSIASRFALMCSPFMCISVISSINRNQLFEKYKKAIVFLISIFFAAYFVFFYSNSGYVPYYTYFQN